MTAEVHDCADDVVAHAEAHRILGDALPHCDAVEIWQLARLVGTVRRAVGAPPASRRNA